MLIITNIATNSIILKFKMQGWSDTQFSFETNDHKSFEILNEQLKDEYFTKCTHLKSLMLPFQTEKSEIE